MIAHNTEQHFGSAVPKKSHTTLGGNLPHLGNHWVKPFKREKIARLIAQTGYFNRNVILIFRFKTFIPRRFNVSKRHGSEIKQLVIAIGMARKQSFFFFGREVDVVWWSVAAKPHVKTYSHIQQ